MLHLLPITPLKYKPLKMGWSGIKYLFHAKSCTSPRRIIVEKALIAAFSFIRKTLCNGRCMFWVMFIELAGDPIWLGLPGEEGNPFERVPCPGCLFGGLLHNLRQKTL